MLDHSWDNLKCNSSNHSSNNSNFHFNNLSSLTNLWTHSLRLILSSSKFNSSNTNKISWSTQARTLTGCREGKLWGSRLTRKINWSNSNNNSNRYSNSNISSNLLISTSHQTNNSSLRWTLDSGSLLLFSNSSSSHLRWCLPPATSNRCSLALGLNSPRAASEMRQISWDLRMQSSNHRWGQIWGRRNNNRQIWWDNNNRCLSNSNLLNKCKEVFCRSSSRCWTLWTIWKDPRPQ